MQKLGYAIQGIYPRVPYREVEYALDYSYLEEVKGRTGHSSHVAEALGLLLENKVLLKPSGVFKGVKRKLFCESYDQTEEWYAAEHVHAFVTAPDINFSVEDEELKEAHPPDKSVFVALVRFWQSNDGQPEYLDPDTNKVFKPRGVIHYWEWVRAAPQELSLPDEYKTRYTTRVY